MSDEMKPECREVLTEVYLYLDLECSETRREGIRSHLDECSPCLRQFGIEQEVKVLVARCCGSDRAPDALRLRIVTRIRQVQVELDQLEYRPE